MSRSTEVPAPTRTAVLTRWHTWAWLLVLIGGEAAYQVIRRVALRTENLRLMPGMVLIGALIVPVSFVVFLRGSRVVSEVTLPIGLVTGIAGGCVSVAVAAGVEQIALDHAMLSAGVVATVEEAAKLAVVAVVLRWVIPWTARNGLIVGAACGAGFAVVETLGYVFVDYLRPDGGMAALNTDLLVRSLFAPFTHLGWTAIAGCALGYAATARRRRRGAVILLLSFAAVALLHTLWDLSAFLPAYLALCAVVVLALTVILRRSRQPSQE